MISLVPELVLSQGDLPVSPSATASRRDKQLLDSYSRTIAAAVNRVAPTVANIRVLSGERGATVAAATVASDVIRNVIRDA